MTTEKIIPIAVILMLLTLLSGCCTTPPSEYHNVTLYPQHRDWWCWAATTEMISDYYGHQAQQCDSANFVHGTPPNCCTGCTGNCPCWDWPWGASISDIQNNWAHWDFSYQYVSSALSWGKLKKTLSKRKYCLKSPVQAVWWWYDNLGNRTSGHVVTITGYIDIKLAPMTLKMVYYNNPAPMDCMLDILNQCQLAASGGAAAVISYEAFKESGNRKWENSFYGFRYTGP